MKQHENKFNDVSLLTSKEIEQIRQEMNRNFAFRPQVECAIQCRNVAALQQWIQLGYEVNEENDQRNTIVHYACKHGDVDVLRCLERNGANFERQNRNGFTPFLVAVSEGRVGLAEWLVKEQKVDHQVKSYFGKTAMWIATHKKYDSMVTFLQSLGHKLTSENDENFLTLVPTARLIKTEMENPRSLHLKTPKWLRKLSALN